MTIDEQLRAGVLDTELTRRALQVALDKTTDMADDVLRVPLHYYRDPKITEIEEAQILRRTPLAVLPSVQVAGPNDYVVRSVLGDSLLITRDKDEEPRVLELLPSSGSDAGLRFRQRNSFHMSLPRLDVQERREVVHHPRHAGFAGMDKGDYGLVELPNQERHGFIWAVLSADADIDVDAHLGDLAPIWRRWTTLVRLSRLSRVRVRGVMEGSARGVRGVLPLPIRARRELIGQNALANTSIHDRFGKHHRMGFPFNWITNLVTDQRVLGRPRQHGRHLLDLPNLIWPTVRWVSKLSISCPPGHPLGAASGTVGWHVCRLQTIKRAPVTTRSSRRPCGGARRDCDAAAMRRGRPPRPARPYDHRPQRNRCPARSRLCPGTRNSLGLKPFRTLATTPVARAASRSRRRFRERGSGQVTPLGSENAVLAFHAHDGDGGGILQFSCHQSSFPSMLLKRPYYQSAHPRAPGPPGPGVPGGVHSGRGCRNRWPSFVPAWWPATGDVRQ